VRGKESKETNLHRNLLTVGTRQRRIDEGHIDIKRSISIDNSKNNLTMSTEEEKPPREYVESLMAKGSYKTSNQSTLEAYADAQATGEGEYYFEANKALLKIYQFLPKSGDPNKVALVLLLAMLEYPSASTDWLSLSYLIPERLQKTEPITTALRCNKLLDACDFVEFWKKFGTINASGDKYIEALVGRATEVLQKGILEAMALTYRSASLEKVLANLNMDASSAATLSQIPCVESVEGGIVVFVAATDNTKRSRVFQEGVSYGAIANMMSTVASSE
jgi:translation initiation factor 3 subunit K